MLREPAAKLVEVDRVAHQARPQQLEHGYIYRERMTADTSVLHREVHHDTAVLFSKGAWAAGERVEERRWLVWIMASGERGGVFERARKRTLVSVGRKTVSLREELVACEQVRLGRGASARQRGRLDATERVDAALQGGEPSIPVLIAVKGAAFVVGSPDCGLQRQHRGRGVGEVFG